MSSQPDHNVHVTPPCSNRYRWVAVLHAILMGCSMQQRMRNHVLHCLQQRCLLRPRGGFPQDQGGHLTRHSTAPARRTCHPASAHRILRSPIANRNARNTCQGAHPMQGLHEATARRRQALRLARQYQRRCQRCRRGGRKGAKGVNKDCALGTHTDMVRARAIAKRQLQN